MKIMIRATNWVGDAIMALPTLRAIRQRHPDAKISIVARPYVADIYREQQVSDELIPYDPDGEHRGWRGREKRPRPRNPPWMVKFRRRLGASVAPMAAN